ncbi:MEG-2 (ESP15) family, partial [Schistosoma mansoni]
SNVSIFDIQFQPAPSTNDI